MRPLTAILLTILAAVVFASWFFTTHEKFWKDEYVGFRGQARANEHLAAELFLLRLGVDAESKATITPTEWLPDWQDTLLVQLSPSLVVESEAQAILEWVDSGGHLVLLPPRESTPDTEGFLRRLGLQIVEVDAESSVDEDPVEYDDEYELVANSGLSRVGLTGSEVAAEVVTDMGVAVAARVERGDGYVTLVASEYYFVNHWFDQDDHARFFADVVAGDLEPGKVWLTYRTVFTPLWQLIWRAAPFLVAALIALAAMSIWSAMPSFGPRERGEAVARRSIMEHISASGVFTWRQRGADCLRTSAIQALIHDAEAMHPGISRQSPQRQAEIIAHITGTSAQQVLDALHGDRESRHREFTQSMQELQSIRKQL